MTIDAEWNFLARVLYIQASRLEKYMASLKITAKIDSQTANAVAICERLINQRRLFENGR
jgi:hypothetical protein